MLGEHRKLDVFIFLLGISLLGALDLTAFPEIPAVLAYEIMILAAFSSVFHLAYQAKRRK